MQNQIKQISANEIKSLNIKPAEYYRWIDEVLNRFDGFILPTKTRVPLRTTDYFNVMPCVLPSMNRMGLKVVTRSEERRKNCQENIDADILLYDYESCNLLSLMDGSLITTIRTAAIAVHSMLHLAGKQDVIAMVGLGNIGTWIGRILFDQLEGKPVRVKLYKYKNHAERFIAEFNYYKNVIFEVCDTYEQLMANSDVVFSSVTFIEEDFCPPEVFKSGCTVIPVHMRGFKECDKVFDHVITSDLESIRKFQYYSEMKKISRLNEVLKGGINVRENETDRILVYNLGIALYDLYFASKMFDRIIYNLHEKN